MKTAPTYVPRTDAARVDTKPDGSWRILLNDSATVHELTAILHAFGVENAAELTAEGEIELLPKFPANPAPTAQQLADAILHGFHPPLAHLRRTTVH